MLSGFSYRAGLTGSRGTAARAPAPSAVPFPSYTDIRNSGSDFASALRRAHPLRRRGIGENGATAANWAGRHPAKSAPRPSPLQAAAETSASSPPVDPWGVEAPGGLDGDEPLKLLAWTGRR